MPSKRYSKVSKLQPPSRPEDSKSPDAVQATILQQQILNIFRDAFPTIFDAKLTGRIQAVKAALYERDFAIAFGSPSNLTAYAARWSPSRALGYARILLDTYKDIILPSSSYVGAQDGSQHHILSIGGGAGAELVAVAALLRSLEPSADVLQDTLQSIHLTSLDIADWSVILQDLHGAITKPPALSKYAAGHIVKANRALVLPKVYTYAFEQHDILDAESIAKLEKPLANADVVTCFFTMNELFSSSIALTNALLHRLKMTLKLGSFFFVIDSAGSYATVALTGSEKSYPMQWLLDHTMLQDDESKSLGGSSSTVGKPDYIWTKVRSEDSTWFRFPDGLKYPLELENMRYQLHLYQKQPRT